MKRFLALLLTIVCIISAVPVFAEAEAPEIEAEAALLMNMDTGEVLFEKNAHEKHYPASMTKMLTCILALENLDMNKKITVRREDIKGVGGNSLKLIAGEQIDVGLLLSGTMVVSANDGAAVLAHEVAGSQSAFADMMNAKAKELGCTDSNFVNPHGLHHRDHYSTCYDIAKIAMYGMKNEVFRRIVSRSEFTIPGTNKAGDRKVKSTNLLLYDTSSANKVTVNGEVRTCKYDGCIGIKTGSTPQAGGCLCSAVTRDGTTLLCVVMSSSEMGRFADSIALFDYGFLKTNAVKVLEAGYDTGKLKIKKAKPSKISTKLAEDAIVSLPQDTSADLLETKVLFDDVKAPIAEGDKVGSLQIYKGEEILAEYDVVACSDVIMKTGIGFLGVLLIIILVLALCACGFIAWFLMNDKKKNDARKSKNAERRAAAAAQDEQLRKEFGRSSKK